MIDYPVARRCLGSCELAVELSLAFYQFINTLSTTGSGYAEQMRLGVVYGMRTTEEDGCLAVTWMP